MQKSKAPGERLPEMFEENVLCQLKYPFNLFRITNNISKLKLAYNKDEQTLLVNYKPIPTSEVCDFHQKL